MAIEIRLARTPAEREQAFRLRYEVYIEEMGQTQKYADHRRRTIEEPLDENGNIFIALDNGVVVGTIRSNYTRESDLGYYEDLYAMGELAPAHPYCTAITTKLMVLAKYRRTPLAVRLTLATYRQGLMDDIRYCFIDCDHELVAFYEGLGFQVHAGTIEHPELGRKVSLVLEMHNLDHLETIRSPMRRDCAKYHRSAEALELA